VYALADFQGKKGKMTIIKELPNQFLNSS